MKKSIIFLTALLLILSLLVAGCGKQGGNTTESGSGSGENTEKQTEKAEPSESVKETEAGDAAQTTGEAVTEPVEAFPPFDKSQPWDGVSACIEWYVNGDYKDGYKISDAYDLYGLSYLVQESALGSLVYYDPNYMVISDSDGDGDLADEAGYSEERVTYGNYFGETEILLTSDIDLNSKPFLPIGASATFRGYFNGQDHTVKNLLVTTEKALNLKNGTEYYYGLFGMCAYGAEVKDFTIENEVIEVLDLPTGKTDYCFIGGVVSYLHKTGGGMISGVKVNGLTVRLSGDMSGLTLVELGAIVGHCGTTLKQSNITVTDYAVEDSHTGFDIHTDGGNNFCGQTGLEDIFTDCSVTMKAS